MQLKQLHENQSITLNREGTENTFTVGQKVRLVSELGDGLADEIKPGEIGTILFIRGPINGRYSLRIMWNKEILSYKGNLMRPVSQLETDRVEPVI